MITKIEKRQDSAGKDIAEQKYNHLAAAEMSEEGNYNNIDGIIDTSCPALGERMKDATNKAKKRNGQNERRKNEKYGQFLQN
jgi:hypothetical protein